VDTPLDDLSVTSSPPPPPPPPSPRPSVVVATTLGGREEEATDGEKEEEEETDSILLGSRVAETGSSLAPGAAVPAPAGVDAGSAPGTVVGRGEKRGGRHEGREADQRQGGERYCGGVVHSARSSCGNPHPYSGLGRECGIMLTGMQTSTIADTDCLVSRWDSQLSLYRIQCRGSDPGTSKCALVHIFKRFETKYFHSELLECWTTAAEVAAGTGGAAAPAADAAAAAAAVAAAGVSPLSRAPDSAAGSRMAEAIAASSSSTTADVSVDSRGAVATAAASAHHRAARMDACRHAGRQAGGRTDTEVGYASLCTVTATSCFAFVQRCGVGQTGKTSAISGLCALISRSS